ncbi:MAG: c-type cytochrome [Thiovulaceae bacterium]|nr:c-type cytochrome [Sulfurimonadaceae bacterium]
MKKTQILAALLTATVTLNATPLYNACSGCHGVKGEKKAMGRSKVINKMGKQDIVTALQGYKTGIYGGAMKAVMKGQSMRLSETDIQTLAEHISKLK